MIDAASVISILQFWIAVTACGLLAWPVAALLLPDDADRGYLAAKPLGWLIGSYAAWLACVAGLPFARFGWLVGLGALLAICLLAARRRRPPLPRLVRLLQWEMGFLTVLVIGVLVRAANPDIAGLEKFMDFGFVNAALRANAMPPPDPWWGGEPINYYYFGHVAAAWLIQLSGVPSDHGFLLSVALIFAFTATLAYRIVAGALPATSARVAAACGVAAATLVSVGGNFHSVLYGPFRAFSGTTYDRDYYYPDSTRFVGFDPPTLDKGFTEMPGYGFAVGDLHAHLLNLPVAFLMGLVLLRLAQREVAAGSPSVVRPIEAAVLSLLFAVSAMCNTWDVVSYGLLMALTGLFVLAQPRPNRLHVLAKLGGWGIAIIASALVLASPFLLVFKPIATELRWSDGHTPAWQLAALYAHIAIPCLILLAGLLTPVRRTPGWVAGALLAALALALIALPEIGFVKDIYGDDHRRANTMFKLTFQAQPVGVMAGFILVGLLLRGRPIASWLPGALLAVPLLAPISYAEHALGSLRSLSSKQFTLNGLGFIDRTRPDDRALLDWLRGQPAERRMIVVEAPGDSFSEAARLSAMSGVPALLGWRGHEWLWRGDAPAVYGRSDEIAAFYRSRTLEAACDFVKAYGVTHVAIGALEREYFPDLDADMLGRLGIVVVRSGNSLLVETKNSQCAV